MNTKLGKLGRRGFYRSLDRRGGIRPRETIVDAGEETYIESRAQTTNLGPIP